MADSNRFEFKVTVLSRYCKGCGLCIEYCPSGVLQISEKPNQFGVQQAYVRSDVACKGCRKCVLICPDAAIEIVRYCMDGKPACEPS